MKKIIILFVLCFFVENLFYPALFPIAPKKMMELSLKNNAKENVPEFVVQEGVTGSVTILKYSIDNKYLFCADEENIRIYEVSTGLLLKSITKFKSEENNADLYPDGSACLYINKGMKPVVLEFATGKEYELEIDLNDSDRRDGSLYVACSPNNKYLAVAEQHGKKISIYDSKTKERLFILDGKRDFSLFYELKFSPDSKTIATITSKSGKDGVKNTVVFWNIESKEIDKTIQVENHSSKLDISYDGKYLAYYYTLEDKTSDRRQRISVVDISTGKIINSISGEKVLYDIKFYPYENFLFLLHYDDNNITIWDYLTNKTTVFEKKQTFLSDRIAFQNKDTYTVGCYRDIEIRSIQDGSIIGKIKGASELNSIQYIPELNILYDGAGGSFFDVSTMKPIQMLNNWEAVTLYSISRDGIFDVISNDNKKELVVRLFSTPDEIQQFQLNEISGFPVLIENSNTEMTAIRDGNDIHIYNLQKKEYLGYYEADAGLCFTEYISPKGNFIISDSYHEKSYIMDFRKGILIKTKDYFITVSSDDSYMARQNHAKAGDYVIYDTATWNEIKHFSGCGRGVFSNNNKYFALGNGRNEVQLFDFETEKLLRVFKTGEAGEYYFVNDDKHFICRDAGGILKCFSVETGELLTCTIGNKDGDWITYTPDGFFMGSETGINKFIHIVDRMKVIELSQMYKVLYRPDIVMERLSGKSNIDDKQALILKQKMFLEKILAPNISFLQKDSVSKKRTVKLNCIVKDTGGGIGSIHISINGRSYLIEKTCSYGKTSTISCDVVLENGENIIQAFAYDASGKIKSQPAEIKITWFGKTNQPNLYVLSVGINEYKSKDFTSLKWAVPDAESIADFFKNKSGSMYKDISVSVITDKNVTKSNISSIFDNLSSKIKPEDVFVFFLSGHGTMQDGDYYFIPADLQSNSVEELCNKGFSKDFFGEIFSKIQAKNVLLLLDTCQSGSIIDDFVFERFTNDNTGIAVISSSSDIQYSVEYDSLNHGLFTHAILDGLNGNADLLKKGQIGLDGLIYYVGQEVSQISKENGYRQSIWKKSPVEDWVLVDNSPTEHVNKGASGLILESVQIIQTVENKNTASRL